jgi:predicted dehydrogenase
MEIYGQTGYVLVPKNNVLRVLKDDQPETETTVAPLTGPEAGPISYLAAVARGEIQPTGDLSSLDVNMTVTEILDAARESAATGRRINLPAQTPTLP